ncbi:MAG TPA: hypothetical protein VGS19_31790 [Streptosporangiaceae bacterium]|nr:hypothetical protein [Streptosporangiaceae bacterium]
MARSRAGWPGVVGTATAVTGAVTMLAACGTAHAPTAGAQAAHGRGAAATADQLGAPAGSRTAALAVASGMLTRLALPQGAQLTQPHTLPAALRQPGEMVAGGADSVDVHRVFTVRQSLTATQHYLASHAPAGMALSGTGQASMPTVIPRTPVPLASPVQQPTGSGSTAPAPVGQPAGPGTTTSAVVDWSLRSLPAGIELSELTVTIVPAAGGSSLLRADAQVTWFPPRTAAEHLDAAAIHNMELSAYVLNPSPHTVRQTITSRAVIRQIVTLLNSLPAAPPTMAHCPMMLASYRVTLLVSAPGGRPLQSVTATPGGCGADSFWADGKSQPPLWDPQAKVTALVDHVLKVKSTLGIRPPPASPVSK